MSLTLKSGFSFGGALQAILPEKYINEGFNQFDFSINSDNYWMYQALLKSMENASIANPNPSVGCLIIKDNIVISGGCTDIWGGKHAERIAFEKINHETLVGSTVYVTLEPCTHIGKQPPCVEIFRNKGIQRVVIACEDPNPIVAGQGILKLKEMGIECVTGVLASEVKAWIYPFYIQQKRKRPFIALKWAQSLDGCFADDNNGWKWISGQQSRKYTHWLRQKYDAILVGAGTLLNDFPSLDVREIKHSYKRDPLKIIYDPFGKVFRCKKEEQEKLLEKTFKNGTKKIILVHSNFIKNSDFQNSQWSQKILNDKEFLVIPIEDNNLNHVSVSNSIIESLLEKSVSEFLGRPLQSVLVEGGPRLLSSFLQSEIFDLIHMFVAPCFLGGEKHRLFSSAKRGYSPYLLREIASVNRLSIKVQERLGEDILLEMIKN